MNGWWCQQLSDYIRKGGRKERESKKIISEPEKGRTGIGSHYGWMSSYVLLEVMQPYGASADWGEVAFSTIGQCFPLSCGLFGGGGGIFSGYTILARSTPCRQRLFGEQRGAKWRSPVGI